VAVVHHTIATGLFVALLASTSWLGAGVAHAEGAVAIERPPPGVAVAIERPRPVDVRVDYPEGGSGSHTVVVELSIGKDGRVLDASVVGGEEPFASATLARVGSFRFEPARRGGVPVPAKVRFAVVFTPNQPEAEPETAGPAPAERSQSRAAAPPALPKASAPDDGFVEITVQGVRPESSASLGQAEIRELPGAFGDAFRAMEIMPGVTPIASGLPYFYVRGAPPGNVGYFFDGVRVPVLYHFAAGPSILHPAFIGQVDLYPGAYPARYGRYAGGILAGEMAEPEYRLRGEASVRLIDSGAMLEVPFDDGRASIMAGGRISYTGLLISLLVPELTVTYWDYQSRTRVPIDRDDSVEILLFGSGDFVSELQYDESSMRRQPTTVADIGFHRLDLRWDRALPQGRWRNALTLGLDRTGLGNGDVELKSYLLEARSELDDRLDSRHRLRAGVDVSFESLGQTFRNGGGDVAVAPMADPGAPMADAVPQGAMPTPAVMAAPAMPTPGPPSMARSGRDAEPGDANFDLGFGDRIDFVGGAYTDVVTDIAKDVEFTPGLRFDVFVSRGDIALGIDPRLRVRYQVHPKVALVHALGLAHQMPSFPIPIPGITPTLKGGLQRALQHSVGAEIDLGGDYTLSTTLFHNVFFGMTDLLGVPDAGQNGFRSLGRAYGLEVMAHRPMTRRLSGFASYTLSRSERYLGRYAGPSTFDRTHVFNLALSYDLGRNWRFGNRFMFYTGIPANLGSDVPDPSRRTPPFFRLDWRLQKRWLYSYGYWGFIAEVLNTTLNEEVVSRSCDESGCRNESIGPVTIPSLGVEGSF
jgi:hypothetical protein